MVKMKFRTFKIFCISCCDLCLGSTFKNTFLLQGSLLWWSTCCCATYTSCLFALRLWNAFLSAEDTFVLNWLDNWHFSVKKGITQKCGRCRTHICCGKRERARLFCIWNSQNAKCFVARGKQDDPFIQHIRALGKVHIGLQRCGCVESHI